jgi:hypothetical protein
VPAGRRPSRCGCLTLARRGWAPADAPVVTTFTVVGLAAIAALLVAGASWRPAIGAALALAVGVEIAGNPGAGFHLPYTAEDLKPFETIAPELRHMAQLAGHDRVWRALPGIQVEHTLNSRRGTGCTINDTSGEPAAPVRPLHLLPGRRDDGERIRGCSAAASRHRRATGAGRRPHDDSSTWRPSAGSCSSGQPRLPSGAPSSKRTARVQHHRHFLVIGNPHALPRAFVTYRARTAPGDPDALLGIMSDPTFDPLVESFVEGPSPFAAAADAPPRGHPAAFVRDDETEVELEVTLERPGLVVLADSFYPGWHATVNGVPAPIVATNHLFRGARAPQARIAPTSSTSRERAAGGD